VGKIRLRNNAVKGETLVVMFHLVLVGRGGPSWETPSSSHVPGTSHALCLQYRPSTGTSHVLLGSLYLRDTCHSCPHVVGNAWDQYSHVLTACEVDWGPLIIIDGELSLSRYYSKNVLASNGECPISGDDIRVGTTERKFTGTTVHHVDDSDAIVALTNPRVVSDYFDHYYTTAQCNNHDASMLPVTVHHELRPPAEPPPERMDFISSPNDDECKMYIVLNTSLPRYFERAISKQVSTFTRLDLMTMNVTTSSSVKIGCSKVDLSNFIDGAIWAMIMGRIDATTAMMIPSGFLVVQLDYVTSVVVYFYQFKFVKIRFKFREPDYYNLMVLHRDWAHSTIKNDGTSMRTSRDDTVLLVTLVAITSYVVNACLPHDLLVMGRSSITGILHLGSVMDYNRALSVDDDAPSKPLVKLVLGNPSYYDDAPIVYDLVMGRPTAGIPDLGLPVKASACWKRTKLKRYESFTMLVVTTSEYTSRGGKNNCNCPR
jgi:DNA-directed RNA polymerase subunit N (RpoN/RPB10)